jgi:hypothetical protein
MSVCYWHILKVARTRMSNSYLQSIPSRCMATLPGIVERAGCCCSTTWTSSGSLRVSPRLQGRSPPAPVELGQRQLEAAMPLLGRAVAAQILMYCLLGEPTLHRLSSG